MSSGWYWWAYWYTLISDIKVLKGVKGCFDTETELTDEMYKIGKSRNEYETVCLNTMNEVKAKHHINDLIAKKVSNIDAVLSSRYRAITGRR